MRVNLLPQSVKGGGHRGLVDTVLCVSAPSFFEITSRAPCSTTEGDGREARADRQRVSCERAREIERVQAQACSFLGERNRTTALCSLGLSKGSQGGDRGPLKASRPKGGGEGLDFEGEDRKERELGPSP